MGGSQHGGRSELWGLCWASAEGPWEKGTLRIGMWVWCTSGLILGHPRVRACGSQQHRAGLALWFPAAHR